uniref:DH domain-containing protein n=1 Tax=Plectus sambesii TaxID=2011161 RepID=A0A914XSD8_9BILA
MTDRDRKLSAPLPSGLRKDSLAMPVVRETRRLSLSILGAKMGRYKPLLRRRCSQPVSNNVRSFTTMRAHSVTSETTLTLPRLDVFNDTRTHIVKELYDTEANYVANLKHMVQKYMRPLKQPIECTLIEPGLVDDIFFKIPEILGHHELFYAALHSRMDNWDSRQKIGDIILNNFTKQSVIDTYTTFINNWKYAKTAITHARTKPAFAKYYDRCSREHKNKLTLEALLIMPVQRIPRYELLLKELLKHTSVEHPDHNLLIRAQKEIHELAIKINHVEQEATMCEQMQQRLREIEAIVDGLDDLVSVDRTFFCHDLVTVAGRSGKKERCLFLMSDQIIVTSVKRKSSGGLRKAGSFVSSPNTDFLDNNKFKLLMKISLEDVEIGRNTLPLLNRAQNELSSAQEDLKILDKITDLAKLLSVENSSLKGTVSDMQTAMRTCLMEKQDEMANDPVLTSLDLLVTTEEGIETFAIRFHNAEKRAAWEITFNNAKSALRTSLARKPPPDFVKSLVMQKTRAGLHFSCATPTMGRNDSGYQNVWVCNSDGYIGQLCVVNVRPEPELESCNAVANSKIRAICPVPVAK